MVDSNWLAVRDAVLRGLEDGLSGTSAASLALTRTEVENVADTVTDHVVAEVELSRALKRSARRRWRARRGK